MSSCRIHVQLDISMSLINSNSFFYVLLKISPSCLKLSSVILTLSSYLRVAYCYPRLLKVTDLRKSFQNFLKHLKKVQNCCIFFNNSWSDLFKNLKKSFMSFSYLKTPARISRVLPRSNFGSQRRPINNLGGKPRFMAQHERGYLWLAFGTRSV